MVLSESGRAPWWSEGARNVILRANSATFCGILEKQYSVLMMSQSQVHPYRKILLVVTTGGFTHTGRCGTRPRWLG